MYNSHVGDHMKNIAQLVHRAAISDPENCIEILNSGIRLGNSLYTSCTCCVLNFLRITVLGNSARDQPQEVIVDAQAIVSVACDSFQSAFAAVLEKRYANTSSDLLQLMFAVSVQWKRNYETAYAIITAAMASLEERSKLLWRTARSTLIVLSCSLFPPVLMQKKIIFSLLVFAFSAFLFFCRDTTWNYFNLSYPQAHLRSLIYIFTNVDDFSHSLSSKSILCPSESRESIL